MMDMCYSYRLIKADTWAKSIGRVIKQRMLGERRLSKTRGDASPLPGEQNI